MAPSSLRSQFGHSTQLIERILHCGRVSPQSRTGRLVRHHYSMILRPIQKETRHFDGFDIQMIL